MILNKLLGGIIITGFYLFLVGSYIHFDSQDLSNPDKVATHLPKTQIKANLTPSGALQIASVSELRPYKIGAGVEQQKLINWTWETFKDKTFIYLAEAESGWRDIRSYVKGTNGHFDWGYYQINSGYHPEIVNDPNFKDPKWQITKGYELYKGGTRFWGLNKINIAKNNFEWK